jgi:hypothetical protein
MQSGARREKCGWCELGGACTRAVWPRVSETADGSCYGDTEVWARLLAESSGDIWARTCTGASVARWGGRRNRDAEAAGGCAGDAAGV